MLLYALLAVVLVIGVLLLVIAARPAEFRYTRSATIGAPPDAVFAHINDLRRWHAWSPWARLDPAMKTTYSGADAGVGAAYAWVGNKQVGEGRMTIIESTPGQLVRFRLEFLKPFAATHTAELVLAAQGGKTVVAWSIFGRDNFMGKAMGLFMNVDKMIGAQFDKGLADLKAIVEAGK